MKPLFLSSLLLLTGAAFAAPPKLPKSPVAKVDFNRDIRPILSTNCFACHGQDPTSRQAKLRLDVREEALQRNVIVAGKPDKSALIARVTLGEKSPLLMPPASTGHKLTAREKTLLTEWVKQGAIYETHWAFRQLTRPNAPKVQNKAWVRNPIDSFVLARLEKAGLKPSPEADRYTLIRRVSLDLIGLPPTPEEVNAYLRDKSPNAYEKLVDRLLASPRYGEHWARMWLDLARYADTQGYEKDLQRTIWRYRDWVIDAFNSDMPYNQFTIEQLAGDLLPTPTNAQLLATAFHRNTMTNTEGGVDGEEFRTTAVKDRIDTTVQVWMGLTMGCAKCHSHKYDPITQQDYYRFYAMFNQTEDANRSDEYPTAPMPTDDQKKKLDTLDAKIKDLKATFWKETPGRYERQLAWEKQLAAGGLWTTLKPESATAESGATIKSRDDGALLVSGPQPDKDTYTLTFDLPPTQVKSIRFEALKDPSLPNGGPGRDKNDQNVVTSEFIVEQILPGKSERTPIVLQNSRADFEQNGWKIPAAIDGNPDTGWAWAPQNGQPHIAVFDLKTPISGGKLIITIKQNYLRLQHGCFRISVSGAEPGLLKAELRPLSELASKPAMVRTEQEQDQLNEAFRQGDPPTAEVYRELAAVEKERNVLMADVPNIPIMRDLAKEKQRITKIHQRGNFLDPGDEVKPAVPESFNYLPSGAPLNRLGAAQWIVSKNNPLTPRVAVNRFWARLFGEGLVETEEDFGMQGTLPTHPELLDWLAATFVASDDRGLMNDESKKNSSIINHQSSFACNWSIKQLLRTIVLSATYRQSGQVTPEKRKLDPRNLLLSRGPRFRLSAETVRDQALAATGLLSSKMHGPSVMPPQPDGIWKTVYSGLKWQTSPGEDRYRRALYTFWRRTSPYPAMTTFDAGSGEFCIVRRVRTNTPLQALVTLNDPAFVEAAGALGKIMLPAAAPREAIITGFRRVLTRLPSVTELTRLTRLYETALADFNRKPDAAQSLLKSANCKPENNADAARLAACATVANVLLNLDETLTKP